jgi:hypothetical protein
MGGYANEAVRVVRDVRRARRVRRLGLVASWLALLMAMPALAGEPATKASDADGDRPVSTRPTALQVPNLSERAHGNSSIDAPLTRAAARLRIEQMSPTEWLSQYGAVTITPHLE